MTKAAGLFANNTPTRAVLALAKFLVGSVGALRQRNFRLQRMYACIKAIPERLL